MRIWVKGYLGLDVNLGGQPFVELDAERVTVRDLLGQLQQGGDPGTPGASGRLAVLVNGRHASHLPDGLDTVLANGDQVAIFPPAAGG